MLFHASQTKKANSRQRSGISVFLYDDTDRIQALITSPITVQVRYPDLYSKCWTEDTTTVPVDSLTDFATIPRLFWNIVHPIGRHTKAAIVHDYLYTTASLTKRQADYVFWYLMKQNGVGAIRRWFMWAAVRIFGKGAWK
jgi:hypothetical protein